jgi:hypothetical protein
MVFLRSALSGSLAGLVLGAIAARAVVFTIGTDVMFETVTWYTIILALVAGLACRRYVPAPRPAVPITSSRQILSPASRPPTPSGPAIEQTPLR